MNGLMVLIALIGIAVSIANKKREAQARRQRQGTQGREPGGPKAAPMPSAQSKTSSANRPIASSKFPPAAPSRSSTTPPKQTKAASQKQQPKPTYGGTPQYTHVVTSTLEGGHTHTESSMTGEEACPPPKPVAQVKQPAAEKNAADNTGALLSFQPNSVLQGVLFAEILGKPKARQRD